MIPKKYLDSDLVDSLKTIKSGISLHDFISAVILTILERNNGNRTKTSKELRIPLKTFRNKLKVIESLGYEVMPYQGTKAS